MKRRVLSTYNLEADKVRAQVEVITGEDFVPLYKLGLLELEDATNAMLNEIKDRMINHRPHLVPRDPRSQGGRAA